MASNAYNLNQFLHKVMQGRSISVDFSGAWGALEKAIRMAGNLGKPDLLKNIAPAASFAAQVVAKRIYDDYSRRLENSVNPIVKEVLAALQGVCEEIAAQPSKYFDITNIDEDTIQVEATLFDMSLFSYRTKSMRKMYYRKGGVAYTGKRKISIAPAFIKNLSHYGQNSPSIGMGWLFEFGRTSSGVTRASQKAGNIIVPYLTKTYLKDKSGRNRRGELRNALLVGTGKGYVFRQYSRWGKSQGLNVIYTQKNVIRKAYVDLYAKSMQQYLQKMLPGTIVRGA